jgi:hypothetical protein
MGKPLNSRQRNKVARIILLCQDWIALSDYIRRVACGEWRWDKRTGLSLSDDEVLATKSGVTIRLVRTIREIDRLGKPRPYRFDVAPLWSFWEAVEAWKDRPTAETAADLARWFNLTIAVIRGLRVRSQPEGRAASYMEPKCGRTYEGDALICELRVPYKNDQKLMNMINRRFPGQKLNDVRQVSMIYKRHTEKFGLLRRKRKYKRRQIHQGS